MQICPFTHSKRFSHQAQCDSSQTICLSVSSAVHPHFPVGRINLPALELFTCIASLLQSWALSVFFNFSNNKKWFFSFSIKLITYFCTSSIKNPSQINLIKMQKIIFYYWKNSKIPNCPALLSSHSSPSACSVCSFERASSDVEQN